MKTTSKLFRTLFFVLFITGTSQSWSQSEAIYDISITTFWKVDDHTSVPESAHWSTLIGTTHSTVDAFMSTGSLASLGIKNVAELGNNTVFRGYITDAINVSSTLR